MIKHRTRVAAGAFVAALALVGAACGDSTESKSDVATTEAPTTAAAASTTASAETTVAGSTTEAATTTGAAAAAPALDFKPLDAGGPLTVAALDNGDIDVALLFSSQGIIASKGWVILKDDKKLQPVDNLVPVVRTKALDSGDGVKNALDAVSAALTTADLSALNLKVDNDKQDPSKVASDYLTSKNLLATSTTLKGVKITVGSANFSEQEIVANMYADVLKAAGADVTTKFKLGSREVVAPALEKGDIDVYPEYVGSYFTFLGGTPTPDLNGTVTALRSAAEPKGITVLDPSPADDINAFVVTPATASKYNLVNISDLAKVTTKLTLGGPPECPTRPFCILGLEKTYGLTFNV